jgi:hypothetical protein
LFLGSFWRIWGLIFLSFSNNPLKIYLSKSRKISGFSLHVHHSNSVTLKTKFSAHQNCIAGLMKPNFQPTKTNGPFRNFGTIEKEVIHSVLARKANKWIRGGGRTKQPGEEAPPVSRCFRSPFPRLAPLPTSRGRPRWRPPSLPPPRPSSSTALPGAGAAGRSPLPPAAALLCVWPRRSANLRMWVDALPWCALVQSPGFWG